MAVKKITGYMCKDCKNKFIDSQYAEECCSSIEEVELYTCDLCWEYSPDISRFDRCCEED